MESIAMTDEYDHDYPPARWSPDDIAATLRETDETYPIPTRRAP